MAQLALSVRFLDEFGKLDSKARSGAVKTALKFHQLTLKQLWSDAGLDFKQPKGARNKHIYTCRIDKFYRGVVLAPDSGEDFLLLRVMAHDDAYAWAAKQVPSVNAVTHGLEIRDVVTVEQLVPVWEAEAASADAEPLFARHTDGDLRGLGIEDDVLRAARSLTSKEQLRAFAPLMPEDQWQVLQFLAEGLSVQTVWGEFVALRAPSGGLPVNRTDLAGAIRSTPARIALVSGPLELSDILDKPFAAWRIFLHPSQRHMAYRPSYSGPAQVTGGPGTGKTVVALHRVKHLLGHLRDGERILLTTYTGALTSALREALGQLIDDEELRDRVEVSTVNALAREIVESRDGEQREYLDGAQESALWEDISAQLGLSWSGQFLAQEYKHVILAQGLRSLDAYREASRGGRGSRLPAARRHEVWKAVEAFRFALDKRFARTHLGVCDEAALRVAETGVLYRHVVVDEAQDLHPAQWRLLRAVVPARPDDLFIAGDPHQRIYDTKVSLKSLGIPVTGRSARMRKNYRSTQEILTWAMALLDGRPVEQLEDGGVDTLAGVQSSLRGTRPTICAAADTDSELAELVLRIREWVDSGVELSDIAVAARFNKIVHRVIRRLQDAGIPAVRLRKEGRTDSEGVRVGTMHSLKGLEFRCVAAVGVREGVLPYPGAITPMELDPIQHHTDLTAERCLLFVACTRARDRLHVSWSGTASRFLTEAGVA
ncbi:UvrD-helicase domain-containing protein [Streptomyces sp. SID9727]|uniref:UvrD-helicase domain-containing protein n=1 Tax=Streptomyces sp. SID9727 TaxID=2706114 RepID=UPI0013C9A4B9|nr:UvrD-helicase domain-containing protein [Streptomyces sp. SID9727]NEC66300.1 AAA family ATPase [Streptomyces sp. SID9727]